MPTWRRAAAVLLLAGWAVFVGLDAWTLPRGSSEQALRADIAACRVKGYLQVYGLAGLEGVWGLRRVGFNTSSQGSGLAWDLGVVVGVLGFVGLLFGPRPQRGTRWFSGSSGSVAGSAWSPPSLHRTHQTARITA